MPSTPTTQIDLDESAFQQRPELKSHLAFESFLALARKPGRELIIDCTLQRRTMKSGFLLALSWMLSRRLSGWTAKQRVGIVFPPGLGGYIANLAVTLAGKVPVNLNFTLGPASIDACMRQAEMDCLLTTERVQHKMPGFPWPEAGIVDFSRGLTLATRSEKDRRGHRGGVGHHPGGHADLF